MMYQEKREGVDNIGTVRKKYFVHSKITLFLFKLCFTCCQFHPTLQSVSIFFLTLDPPHTQCREMSLYCPTWNNVLVYLVANLQELLILSAGIRAPHYTPEQRGKRGYSLKRVPELKSGFSQHQKYLKEHGYHRRVISWKLQNLLIGKYSIHVVKIFH